MAAEQYSQNNKSNDEGYFLHSTNATNHVAQQKATSNTQFGVAFPGLFPSIMDQSQHSKVEYSPEGDRASASGLATPTSVYQPSPGFDVKSFPEDFKSFGPAASSQQWTVASLPMINPSPSYATGFEISTSLISPNFDIATTGLGLFNATPHSSPQPPALPSPPQPPTTPLEAFTKLISHSFEPIFGTGDERVKGFIKPSPHEARRFICTFCADSFTGKLDTLREHVRKHLGITKLFRCLSCEKTFTTQRAARRHQQTQMKKWHCQVCGQSFARLDYAKKHQQRCETRHGLTPQLETLSLTNNPSSEEGSSHL